ncbi:MAG TPA: hypothetical protein VF723_16490 [Pyrinomonadaceae bacterium]
MSDRRSLRCFACTLLLLAGALVLPALAQEQRKRPVPSLTSEDLLDRRVAAYAPEPSAAVSTRSSATTMGLAPASSYRDPAGAFTLSFPNGDWRVNTRAKNAGKLSNHGSFRRIDAEGFASATANIYVLTGGDNLSFSDPVSLGTDEQRELAAALAARFLSSSSSLVSVEANPANARAGLRIIADQLIARRPSVRASINVFERQGRLFVIVCCAPLEIFDASLREFSAITDSLASSVLRS